MTLFVRERADLWKARAWALALAALLLMLGMLVGWWLRGAILVSEAAAKLAESALAYRASRQQLDSLDAYRLRCPLAGC